MASSRVALWGVMGIALSACACGAASKQAASPVYDAPEPKTLDEAEAQLAQAERDLGGGASGAAASEPSAPSSTGSATSGAMEPTPAPAASPPRESDVQTESDGETDQAATRSATCETPCRAIASMRNAVRAICRLAGDADPKCTEAKGKLSASESRVATCGC